jgi:nucleotidyltransferase substrate binding protein (TIGR01987 family)
MSKQRFVERQAECASASNRLLEAIGLPESDIARDATIQRFEFTFELVWKTLKLYLERQGLECGGPRMTLKMAFIQGLIQAPKDGDVWLTMLADRNLTSHAYDEALAKRIVEHIRNDYAPLLHGMVQTIQQLAWD